MQIVMNKMAIPIILISLIFAGQSNGNLIIDNINSNDVTLSFSISNAHKDKSHNIMPVNYILECDYKNKIEMEYIVNSTFPTKIIKNDYFSKGIAKEEIEFDNQDIVSISNQFSINNKHYIQLTINPIYNFDGNMLITNSISITIKNLNDINILNTFQASELLTRQNIVANPSLLIIAPNGDNIFNLMTPFINWKKLKGYKVFYHQLDEGGNTNTEIKEFIQSAYNNWEYPPNYICIIGDADGAYAVPTFNEALSIYNGESDHPYTLLDGNDNISDVAIGRLSIRSISDLATIINKIINYEQYPYISNTNWFERALCVGDPSVSGSSTVITNQIIAELMIANGFDEVTEVYQFPFVNQIENFINSGVSFYNYRGFAGSSGWEKDGADNLNNGYMLPVVSVITCDTGSFLEDEQSISENFLKAGSISIPKGGIAGIGMSTQGTHTMFNNCLDYGLYHALFVEKIERLGDVINYSKNNLWFNYPNNPNNYVDIFSHWINLMGDPTLSVWTATPQPLTINDNLSIPWGQNFLDLHVSSIDENIQNAKIVITDQNLNLITTGTTDLNGNVYLTWEQNDIPVGTYNLLVTKQNHIPNRYTLEINEVNHSFNLTDLTILDSNQSSDLNPNDTFSISFKIKNYGLENISNIEGSVILDDNSIILSNSNFNFENIILSGQSSETITINGIIENVFKKEVLGEIFFTDGINDFLFPFSLIINGPDINMTSYQNSFGENYLNSNLENEFFLTLINNGTQTYNELEVILSSNYEYINFENNSFTIPPLDQGESYISSMINASIGYQVYPGMQIPITVSIYRSNELLSEKIYNLSVEQVTQFDPLGPDTYGYYIYDHNDVAYANAPIYNWIEIDPYLSGLGTILISLNDDGENQDDVTFVNLPFTFQFYGHEYQQISISTNGWIKPGLTNQSSFRNWRLPGAGGPSPMISAFWDDLKTGPGRICVDYDSTNKWYIIEWSNMQNGFDNSIETFQVIIYDEDYYPTLTGDNIIKIQYKEFNNVNSGHYDLYNQWHGNYASVGIENENANTGLEYTWNNEYPISASNLENESAILITTNIPVSLNQILGDINQDNQLDILDIVRLVYEITFGVNTDSIIIIADMNQDFSIDVLDIVILVDTILNI